MIYNNKLDNKIKELFRQMPLEEVSPSVKVEVMNRIEDYQKRWNPENLFLKVLYRVSGFVLVASMAVMLFLLPTITHFERSRYSIQQADAVGEEYSRKTNYIRPNRNISRRDGMNYVNYVSYR